MARTRRDLIDQVLDNLGVLVPGQAPGDEAVFFFPRLDEKGAPLLTLDNKELLINLANNQADSISNFKIDVTKLKLNGKVEF